MTLTELNIACWAFGYDVEIDGDKMLARVYIGNTFSHVIKLV